MASNSVFASQEIASTYYQFKVKESSSFHNVSILADSEAFFVHCSCGCEKSICSHIEKLIHLDKNALVLSELIAQKKMIESLNSFEEGKNFLKKFTSLKQQKPSLFLRIKTNFLKSISNFKLSKWLLVEE